jgi:uncharacterized delta-60 repeat protein
MSEIRCITRGVPLRVQRRIVVLAILAAGLCWPPGSFAQVQQAWVARYRASSSGGSNGRALAVDNEGNVYVTGHSYGVTLDFATLKYATNGAALWTNRYDGPVHSDDQATAIALDSTGNAYVTGWSWGTNGYDYATAIYGATGIQLGVVRYDSPGESSYDYAIGVAVDAFGNFYVAGSAGTVRYSADGDLLWVRRNITGINALGLDSSGNILVAGQLSPDTNGFATVKYDSEGTQLWLARYFGLINQSEVVNGLATDSSDNVYVTGPSANVNGSQDYATIKYDKDGNQLWVARYDGPSSGSDNPIRVKVNSAGEVYVIGASYNPGAGYDYTTVKYDSVGNQLWVARYNGPGNGDDYPTDLALNADGNVYVTGQSFSPSTSYDYATVKYDANGNRIWVMRYNGPVNQYDSAAAIAVDSSNGVYVTGGSTGINGISDYATIRYLQVPLAGLPLITKEPQSQTVLQGARVSFSVTATGDPVLRYQWRFNEQNISGATNSTLVLTNVQLNQFGEYSVEVKNNAGVIVSPEAQLTLGAAFTSEPVSQTVMIGGEARFSAVLTGEAAQEYQWLFNGAMVPDATNTVLLLTNVSTSDAGSYALAVTTSYGSITSRVASLMVSTVLRQAWVAKYDGGMAFEDTLTGMALDSAGNVYVTGYSYEPTNYTRDIATIKYDASGRERWVAHFGNPNLDDAPNAIAVDSAGNVFVTGQASGVSTANDILILKYDPDGTRLWNRTLNGGPGYADDFGNALAVDSGGSVYVTGSAASEVNGDDYVTLKYSPAGSRRYAIRYNGPANSFDSAAAIVVDSAASAHVTGRSAGTDGSSDFATVKYSTNGNQLWVACYDGPMHGADSAVALAIDSSGNVYVTGSSEGLNSGYDFATLKYDTNGNQLWAARYNGRGNSFDIPIALAVHDSGNVYVTGWSDAFGDDYITLKYDPNGNQLWVARYNGPGNGSDTARGLGLDAAGNVYVTGQSYSSENGYDFATIKYDANGNRIWVARYDGLDHLADGAGVIRLDGAGNLYVAGWSQSSSSGYDYALVKYVLQPDTEGLPLIIAPPLNQIVLQGEATVFSVTANTPEAVAYQWLFNGVALAGATNAVLEVTNIQLAQTGGYSVSVSNGVGVTVSPEARLSLAAAITSQPVSRTVMQGLDVSFFVGVTGEAPQTYQWLFNGTNLAGGTATALTLTNVQAANSGNYALVVTTSYGSLTSQVAVLNVSTIVGQSWVARYDGAARGDDNGRAIKVDTAGNVYVTGNTWSGGNYDYATIKYDTNGHRVWVASYNGPANDNDYASKIAVGDGGNVYITGYSYGTNRYDYATLKYDNDGNRLWVARYDGPANGDDLAQAITVDREGNVYVTGYSVGTAYDYATIKYDGNGNQLWAARFNGSGNGEDIPSSLAVDGAGNAYVTGYSRRANPYDYEYVTIKYSTNGNQLWAAHYNGPVNGDDFAAGLALDGAGNVYVTGSSYGGVTGNDYATVKYDPNGLQLWVMRYNGPGNGYDYAQGIALDGMGNVYVTGYSYGSGTGSDYATVKYSSDGVQRWVARYDSSRADDYVYAIALDSGGSAYITGYSWTTNSYSYDFATVRYDPNGNQLWAALYNGPGGQVSDYGYALAVDKIGQIYVTGYSAGDYATIKYIQSNAPPRVRILNPSTNSIFVYPTNIFVRAQVSDTDGAIVRVDFLDGATSIASLLSSPYAITWTNAPPGDHVLSVSAMDNFGLETASLPLSIQVLFLGQPPRLTLPEMLLGGQFRFTLFGDPGYSYTIQSSTDLIHWSSVTNFISVTGTNQCTNPARSDFNQRFYRAVTP